MRIRLYKREDLDTIMHLYYESVHEINSQDYSDEELDVMAPAQADRYHWESALEKNHTIVCESNDHIVGFGNIGMTGFLDDLYVDKNYLKKGIASELLQHLEDYSRAKDNYIINVYAPITAVKFFEKHGYQVVEESVNELHGVRVLKYLMEKKLK